MKLKYQLAVQEIAGTYMAVAVGADARKYSNVLNLNETGKEIVEQLQQETTVDAIVVALSQKYEGEESVIRASVEKIVKKLTEEGLLG